MKTVRRPPYPKWNPGYFPCSSLTPPSAFLTPSIGVLRWIRVNAVVKVTARREIATETSVQSRYYISSLAGQAKTLLSATRSHWSIENSLHWSLDVTFREDHS